MIIGKFIAKCDHNGCKSKTKAIITIKIAQTENKLTNHVAMLPLDIKLKEDGWTWGWNIDKTETLCPVHSRKKK